MNRAEPAGRPTVGILGTGRMGAAMAACLAGRAFPLVLYNRTPERARDLAGRVGGSVAASPAEAAARADVVISMVADDDAVVALYREPGGVLEGLRPGSVAVDMSTVLPDTIRGLAGDVRARGAGVLDAPVSGSVPAAESGQLTVMVGGEADDLERARPAIDGLAGRVFHVGPLGSGATMKLAVNTIVFGLNGALAEAIVLAERAGVDRAAAYEVFAASVVGAPFLQYKKAAFLDPGQPPAFAISLAEKDLALILELARRVGVGMPQARTNLDVLADAERSVGAERDFSAVAEHFRVAGIASGGGG